MAYIVGTYSPGNELVVYDISIHVLPTEPSPTTTHLMSRSVLAIPLSNSYLLVHKSCLYATVQSILPVVSKEQKTVQ